MRRSLFYIVTFILVAFMFSGCSQGGPTLSRESIDASLPEKLKTSLSGLYARDTDDVILSIRSIGEMGADASAAAPYLSSMLMDTRLGTRWTGGYGKTVPVSKEAAFALGQIGESGVTALADALKGTVQVSGMEDDLLRESVAQGMDSAMVAWGETVFTCLRGTDRVNALIHTAQVCLHLEEYPGRLDKTDPRRSLKYYKHFQDTGMREGLMSFLRTLGCIGDHNALAFLESLFPLSKDKQKTPGQSPSEPFETTAVIAQYRIHPLPLEQIHPPCAELVMIEFTAVGDSVRTVGLLEQGMNPDITTQTGQPLIELAWKQNHTAIFETLIKHGAQVDIRISNQDTLLIRASREGDHEFAKALLDHGADPTLANNAKETALDAAVTELFSFWNEKPYDTKAKPYFKTIKLLQAAGSPPVNAKILKEIGKPSRTFLKLE